MAGIRSKANIEITSFAGNRKISLGGKTDKIFIKLLENEMKSKIEPRLKEIEAQFVDDTQSRLIEMGLNIKTRFRNYDTRPRYSGREFSFKDLREFPQEKREFKTEFNERTPHLSSATFKSEVRKSTPGSLKVNLKTGRVSGIPSISFQMTAGEVIAAPAKQSSGARQMVTYSSRRKALGKGLDQYDSGASGKAGRFDKFYGLEYGTKNMKPAPGTYTPFSQSIVRMTDESGFTRPPMKGQTDRAGGDGIYGYFTFDRIFKDEYGRAMSEIQRDRKDSLEYFIRSIR